MIELKNRPVPSCSNSTGHYWKLVSTNVDECELCGMERVFEHNVSYYIHGLKVILPEHKSTKEKNMSRDELYALDGAILLLEEALNMGPSAKMNNKMGDALAYLVSLKKAVNTRMEEA